MTPHHLRIGSAPNLEHMRVFGSRCWYVLPGHKVKKLDSRAREAIMVVSRSVRFDESLTDTVDVDTASETDEEVQTVPTAELKSVPVLARLSDDTEDPGDTPNNENNDSPVVVTEPDDSQQATTAPILRRSSRISRPPRPFWIAPSNSATLALVSTNVATDECFISTDVTRTGIS